MGDARQPPSREDLEAQRELLREAIADLPSADNPHQAANEVLRALDAYMENAHPAAVEHRESPVTDFAQRALPGPPGSTGWTRWIVFSGAILASLVVAVVLSGGWPAGAVIVGIWALALIVMTNT
ncbi:MAG: hypothetical protein QOD86_2300 [Miltoncostaeaceae bacterium]|jgi:hypothetical protein|nr:hypothetical protein [Miltoncostaeaceae bacterium]